MYLQMQCTQETILYSPTTGLNSILLLFLLLFLLCASDPQTDLKIEREEEEGGDQTHGNLKREEKNPIKDRRRRKCMQSDDFPTKGNCITGSMTRCFCIIGKKKNVGGERHRLQHGSMDNWVIK